MYINPFWCGVIVTILVKLAALVGSAICMNVKENNK